jgi:hypothetical protein
MRGGFRRCQALAAQKQSFRRRRKCETLRTPPARFCADTAATADFHSGPYLDRERRQCASSSSNALASLRSTVSSPSVNPS